MKKLFLLVTALLLVAGMVAFAGAQAEKKDNKFACVGVLHPYFDPMGVATKDYMAATGITTEYRATQHFDMEEENVIIDGMKALKFNAFALWPGHPNSVNATISELKKQGIPVILVGGPANLPTDAALCIATDVAASAAQATELLVKAMGGKGNVVDLLGELSDPNTLLRKEAVEKVLAKYPNVKLLQEISSVDSFEAAESKIGSFLAARGKDVDGMVSTAYVASVVNAGLLTEIGDKRIKFIGIDDDPKVLAAIKAGYVTGTMSQAPYGQAYLALTGLALLRSGYTVKAGKYFIDSGHFLIDTKNADSYKDQIKTETAAIAKTFKDKYFDAPK